MKWTQPKLVSKGRQPELRMEMLVHDRIDELVRRIDAYFTREPLLLKDDPRTRTKLGG